VVTFHVNDAHFGPDTKAFIKLKTLLGADYLQLEPHGKGQLKSGGTIPLAHTTPAYEIVPAFRRLTQTIENINTAQLAKALTTLADTFRNTPVNVRQSLDGLAALSKTIASRDDEVSSLLNHAAGVTDVLAKNSADIVSIVNSTNQVLVVLNHRRDAIDQLLAQSKNLAIQLSGLVNDNEKDIGPTLKSLNTVLAVLDADKKQLTSAIENLKPFITVFTGALGSAGDFDTTIKFGSTLAVCDNLSALNKASSGSSQPCLPLAVPGGG
jgi:phospholipid/cholesterol/gamma-HCH transport system substrate-binding protein